MTTPVTTRLENLSWLIDWAARNGAPDRQLRAASAEYVNALERLAVRADERRVESLAKALRLVDSGATLRESGLPRTTYYRRRQLARESQRSRDSDETTVKFNAWLRRKSPSQEN